MDGIKIRKKLICLAQGFFQDELRPVFPTHASSLVNTL